MPMLVPCSSCNRHVESEETSCPFCGAALVPRPDPRTCSGPCSGHALPRLSRAALAAAGATLLCSSCLLGTGVHYGTAVEVDAGGQTGGVGVAIDGGPGGAGGGTK